MKTRLIAVIGLLFLTTIGVVYSAPGTVTTIGPPRAFGNISTAGSGKILATSNRDTLKVVGVSGLTISTTPSTKTLTLSGAAFINSSSAVRKAGDTMTGQLSGTVFDASTGYRVGGAAASANYLRGNGANFVSSSIQAADVPTLNQSTTGNAATVTTNANLTGPITSVGNATSIASQTGTGTKFVVDTSPTVITPTITTSATVPLIIGGTAVDSKVTYKSTTGAGTATGIAHQWLGGTDGATVIATMLNTGNVGVKNPTPTALVHIGAGTAAAGGAPFKFTSGTLLTTAEAGAVEFLTDAFYGTITTGAARKTFAFLESPSFTTPNIGVATGTSLSLSSSIKLSTDATACSATNRGAIRYTAGAAGASDKFEACVKSAADAYAWLAIYTAP